ncbi:hypothetical protein Fcan01_16206 [Folsomia candida]|uniref:Uncharacterized protein n=1 Tax=Folsomia candida TaxID=158441 RepID=A0A226DTM0_FOLCA|nr:hypothetical protein Fcan01_16206 [Folsomia candida]
MSIIVSICESVLKIAKDRYRYSGDSNASSILVNNVEIVDRVLRFVEDLVDNSNTDFESSITLEFDYDCDIDTYVEAYDLISDSDTINEFHEDSEDEQDVEEASASLSQRISQEWEEEDVDGVNFTYQEMVFIYVTYIVNGRSNAATTATIGYSGNANILRMRYKIKKPKAQSDLKVVCILHHYLKISFCPKHTPWVRGGEVQVGST